MGYTFAKVYAAMCLIFSASIALGLVANVEVTLWPAGRTYYPGLVRTLSFGFMIGLYLATAIAILKRRPSAVVLVNTGAIVGALGILARGLVPIDFMLYIPTAIAVGYFHRRKNLLLGIASGPVTLPAQECPPSDKLRSVPTTLLYALNGMMFVLLEALFVSVVPRFKAMFAGFGAKIPLATELLFTFSVAASLLLVLALVLHFFKQTITRKYLKRVAWGQLTLILVCVLCLFLPIFY